MTHSLRNNPELPDLISRLVGMHSQEGRNLDPLLTRKQAAIYLGLSPRTLAIWATTNRYKLKMVKIGRLAKYRTSVLDAFIVERSK